MHGSKLTASWTDFKASCANLDGSLVSPVAMTTILLFLPFAARQSLSLNYDHLLKSHIAWNSSILKELMRTKYSQGQDATTQPAISLANTGLTSRIPKFNHIHIFKMKPTHCK